MKIKSNMKLKYNNSKNAEIVYKSLEVDNEGFLESKLNSDEIEYNIESDNLGTFLNTADDLIASEILVEDLLKNTSKK
ncbi:MAG: hypothetical protein IKV87_05305 [Methanobrevibacter sp.]|nr:hypothetical protein [Methanobrevibacter sp.]